MARSRAGVWGARRLREPLRRWVGAEGAGGSGQRRSCRPGRAQRSGGRSGRSRKEAARAAAADGEREGRAAAAGGVAGRCLRRRRAWAWSSAAARLAQSLAAAAALSAQGAGHQRGHAGGEVAPPRLEPSPQWTRERRSFPHRRLARVTELAAAHKRNKKSPVFERHLRGSEGLRKYFFKKEKDTPH